MKKTGSDREYLKTLEAFSLVTSLAFMTVFDFLLAYFGGDWLDNYFQTGDHSWRTGCICLAIVAVFMNFYRLVAINLTPAKKEAQKDEKTL